MEKRYKVGLIGAIVFAFLTLLFNLVFNLSLTNSELISLALALIVSIVLYKLEW